nr:MAG: hypothetical protein [Microvirus sp.]
MQNFNWMELLVTIGAAVLSYITGHKVGKKVGKDSCKEE